MRQLIQTLKRSNWQKSPRNFPNFWLLSSSLGVDEESDVKDHEDDREEDKPNLKRIIQWQLSSRMEPIFCLWNLITSHAA